MSGSAQDASEVRRTLEQLLQARLLLAARCDELEARLEALDASFVRHQGQNEDDFRRAEASVDRVGQDLSNHLDAHWRSQ